MVEFDLFFKIYISVIVAILGAVFGSFLNCLAWRITHNESVLKGRSHCATCGHELCALDLVPIFSWIFLKGKCRYCGEKVSIRYPLSELALAIISILVLFQDGLSLLFIRDIIFIYILFTLTLTDLYDYLIPDTCIILSIINWLGFAYFTEGSIKAAGLRILAAFVFGGILLLIVLLFDRLMKKESMGGGDIKLIFVCVLYLGMYGSLFMMLLACVVGLVFAYATKYRKNNESRQFPFGPAIAVSTGIMLLYGTPFLEWYMSLL